MRLVCAANQQRSREGGPCGRAGILNVGVVEEVHLKYTVQLGRQPKLGSPEVK